MSKGYIVEEINSANDFLSLKEAWNELVFEDPSSTIFQTWEWNFNIWKYNEAKSQNLNVLLVREENGNLVGIAPFYFYEKTVFGLKIRIIEFIGKNFSDYRDFIVKPGDNIQIYAEILSWLNKESGKWDIVDLRYLSGESPLVKNYDKLFGGLNLHTVIQQQNISPYIALHPGRNVYENLYNQSLVKYLKRKTRKLEKDLRYKLLTVSNLSELDGYLNRFFDLHKKRRNQKLQLGTFRSENKERLFTDLSHDLLKKGWLKLSFLLVDDELAACLYNFEFKNKIYFYQSGLEPKFGKYSLGYLIHFLAIEEALKEGMEEYDFLSGNEDYKKEWAEDYRNVYRIKITSSDSKKAVFFNSSEKLSTSFYNSNFYKSQLIRKLYFSVKNLGKKSEKESRAEHEE